MLGKNGGFSIEWNTNMCECVTTFRKNCEEKAKKIGGRVNNGKGRAQMARGTAFLAKNGKMYISVIDSPSKNQGGEIVENLLKTGRELTKA